LSASAILVAIKLKKRVYVSEGGELREVDLSQILLK